MDYNSHSLNWEEDELESPIGRTRWVFNSITQQLAVLSTVKTTEGEDAPWDELQYDIESAALLEGVESICDRAFKACWNLKTIQIPNSVTSIGDEAFFFAVR